MNHIHRIVILLLFSALTLVAPQAKPKTQASEARELFDRVYNLVFGPQGSSLSYSVNIVGLYKTQGDIVYKGKKLRFSESRYSAWEDGVTAYRVDKKKRTVDIYRPDDDRKDEYLSKFKYDVNNYDFSYTTSGDYYTLTAKVRGSKFFGIREVQAKVLRTNLHPVSLTIKLAFLHTTVRISNFHSGGITDAAFQFPRNQFQGYKYTDHR